MKYNVLLLIPGLILSTSHVCASELTTDEQKISYIFGVQTAEILQSNEVTDHADIDALLLGFQDATEGTPPRLDQQSGEAAVAELEQRKQAETIAITQENLEAAETFFAENAKRADVVVTESGLQYRIIKAGDGPSPIVGDEVKVHVTGRKLNSEVFYETYNSNQPMQLPMDGMMDGWTEALASMKTGAIWEVFVPPHLAYGEIGSADVEPGEGLIFDLELLSIVDPLENASLDSEPESGGDAFEQLDAYEQYEQAEAEAVTQRNLQLAEKFFTENAKRIDVTVTESGLQYRVIQEGDGPSPIVGDEVKVHFTGRKLNDEVFYETYTSNQPMQLPIDGMMDGWTEALASMKTGDIWEVFVPPHLAYSNVGSADVEPGEGLVFDLELLSIEEPY